MKRSKAWEHVKPSTYITKEKYKQMKRDALITKANGGTPPIIERPGVTPHPKMQQHINNMMDSESKYRTRMGLVGVGKSSSTKSPYNKKGRQVRTSYAYVLKGQVKKQLVKTVETEVKDSFLRDKLINQIFTATPNTTLVINKTRNNETKVKQKTITLTDSMFQRVIFRPI